MKELYRTTLNDFFKVLWLVSEIGLKASVFDCHSRSFPAASLSVVNKNMKDVYVDTCILGYNFKHS